MCIFAFIFILNTDQYFYVRDKLIRPSQMAMFMKPICNLYVNICLVPLMDQFLTATAIRNIMQLN